MGYAPVQAPPYAPKPKNSPTPKKDNPTKDAICHQCGEVFFTIELYSFPSTSWVYDTGCGTHICRTTQGLKGSRKLKPRALSLYVGNGRRAAVEAIGDFHLCLPSGFNNMIYFNAIPRDDIYEIVMSSNTNEYSMYALTNKRAKLNLDSALLWHCRLGHINKKRIEKLQHDGLLDSTDIKSLEKCVACMSGYPKETMGYSFYYPPENKIFVARNAEFFKNKVIDHEASGSLEDLEIIQKEDTHPSLDTSLNHEVEDQEIDEP
ncbi:retrotransposon protein, putative, ty1-copia subclass [Tanacetum coccineum]